MQQFNQVLVIQISGNVQWQALLLVGKIDVCIIGDQVFCDDTLTVFNCDTQRRVSLGIMAVDISTI